MSSGIEDPRFEVIMVKCAGWVVGFGIYCQYGSSL